MLPSVCVSETNLTTDGRAGMHGSPKSNNANRRGCNPREYEPNNPGPERAKRWVGQFGMLQSGRSRGFCSTLPGSKIFSDIVPWADARGYSRLSAARMSKGASAPARAVGVARQRNHTSNPSSNDQEFWKSKNYGDHRSA